MGRFNVGDYVRVNDRLHGEIISIEDSEEYDDDYIVDKIASFFENDDNWRALKQCCLINDYSEDLRKLLRKALV